MIFQKYYGIIWAFLEGKREYPKGDENNEKGKTKMTEAEKKEWAAMEDRLMPGMGKADTVAGEIIRAVDRIHYRWWNDGDRINVGYGKETCNGTARYLEKIRGTEFPVEIWSGRLNDDEYTEFTERLVEEMFAFIKARPELEATPNTEDSRADFIDDDLDRDDSEDEDEEYED